MTVTLTWLGHSAFELISDDSHVLIDPFITGNPMASARAEDLHPTTILLTHAHNDHVGDTIEIAQRTGAMVIATPELAGWIERQGAPNVGAGNHGGTVRFAGGTAKFVPAWHTSSYSTDSGAVAPGVPAGFVVRVDGRTIYFAGDTALFLDMQLIADEGLDVAVLPIGDNFTMGPSDAAKAAALLKAPTVLPCHYNTFPPIEQDPKIFRELVQSTSSSRVIIPLVGETVDITTSASS